MSLLEAEHGMIVCHCVDEQQFLQWITVELTKVQLAPSIENLVQLIDARTTADAQQREIECHLSADFCLGRLACEQCTHIGDEFLRIVDTQLCAA